MKDNYQNMDELDKTMYFNAKPDILEAARILRTLKVALGVPIAIGIGVKN